MQRVRINENITAIQHERRECLHRGWEGGERICYTQLVEIEIGGEIVQSNLVRFWHRTDGTLVRVDLEPQRWLGAEESAARAEQLWGTSRNVSCED